MTGDTQNLLKRAKGSGLQKGFTLLEVLMAMAIFAIGILAIATMQISSTNGNATARKVSEASEYGQGQIESLMSGPFANVVNGTTQTNGYTITWTVTPIANPAGLSVQVVVQDPRGVTRSALTFSRYPNI